MRVAYTPPVDADRRYLSADFIDQWQEQSNARYKGVEAEIVTETTKFGRCHILKMYVDGIEVAGGLQGLTAAMENRLGT